jgi:hypothetical protein
LDAGTGKMSSRDIRNSDNNSESRN